jgi:hypothetical protein
VSDNSMVLRESGIYIAHIHAPYTHARLWSVKDGKSIEQ